MFKFTRIIVSNRFKFGEMNLKPTIPQILHLSFLIHTMAYLTYLVPTVDYLIAHPLQ